MNIETMQQEKKKKLEAPICATPLGHDSPFAWDKMLLK
jgi:hypothetical protein